MTEMFRYKGKQYPTMALDEAVSELLDQRSKGKHMAVIETLAHGGKPDEYIVVEAEGTNVP